MSAERHAVHKAQAAPNKEVARYGVPLPAIGTARPSALQRKCAACGQRSVSDECEGCARKRQSLQRRGGDGHEGSTVPSIVHEVLGSSGRPLDPGPRAYMEPRFGHDFGKVRIHTDARAAESAQAVNALAYTVGVNVVFGAGRYAPASPTGRQLIAHELAHVVQQQAASSLPNGISSSSDASEREAEKAASAALEREPRDLLVKTSSPLLQRQEGPGALPTGPQGGDIGREPAPEEDIPPVPTDEKSPVEARTDAFGKECPDSAVLQDTKAIPAYGKKMFDAGFKTYFGLVSNMKVGPKGSYEACITEVLKVEENTCGDQGNMADYEPCTPKKHCMKIGEACGGDVLTDTKFPCSNTTFVDLHKTQRDVSLLEGSGKTECKAKCLQRYGCGGKEIGRFYITRNFKAGEFMDGTNKVHVTIGSIVKEATSK